VGAELLEAVARQAALGERDGAARRAGIGAETERQKMETGRVDACGTAPDQRVAGDIDERVRVVVAEAEAAQACDRRCTSSGAILVDVQIEAQARQARGLPRPGMSGSWERRRKPRPQTVRLPSVFGSQRSTCSQYSALPR
jgi:hypothetical protein